MLHQNNKKNFFITNPLAVLYNILLPKSTAVPLKCTGLLCFSQIKTLADPFIFTYFQRNFKGLYLIIHIFRRRLRVCVCCPFCVNIADVRPHRPAPAVWPFPWRPTDASCRPSGLVLQLRVSAEEEKKSQVQHRFSQSSFLTSE